MSGKIGGLLVVQLCHARDVFFRVSRSCISNIRSIRKSSRYFGSRLKLYFEPECPHEVLVSRSRVADFLKWVDGVV